MTSTNKIKDLELWLHLNAFWNADLVEIKKSKTSNGLGVFQRQSDVEDDDRLLFRIPKGNILSIRNSSIANLIEDYVSEQTEMLEEKEESEDYVDMSIQLHGLVLCLIYEHSMGIKSPWFEYINSIDLKNGDLPLCLWDEDVKKLLQNTECDLLHMLDLSELTDLFVECIRFARINSPYVNIPSVLEWEGDDIKSRLEKDRSQLESFGRFLQAVLSRSFPVDAFHGLSLVPGADLFNHSDEADVQFVREEDVCEECGETECDHDQDDQVESEDDDEEFDDEEIEEILNDVDTEEEEEVETEGNVQVEAEEEDETMALDKELESSDDELESEPETETELVTSEDETSSETEEVEEITTEYIEQMERELEEEENEENEEGEEDEENADDNESLLEISDDEEEASTDDLAKQLASDQCCNVFLLNPKSGEELYNFYGSFSNPLLLQRYGFVKEENVDDTCMLTVQMFGHIKKITGKRGTQLDIKLQWYEEMGFELVNDLLKIGLHTGEHDHDHDHDHDSEGDGCCGSDSEEEEDDKEDPISWELSPRVNFDGSPTPQTYALLRLMLMPFNLFQAKFLHCQSENKLCRRILKLLLPNSMPISHPRIQKEHEQVFKIFNAWCRNRLSRHKDGMSIDDLGKLLQDESISNQKKTIFTLLKLEKEILTRGSIFSPRDYDELISEE